MILDVGCGNSPRGDVNLDLLVEDDLQGEPIQVNIIPNFVRGDVESLPFRNGAFSKVHCHHVLEHTEDPGCGVSELLRVANGRVVISVPFIWFEWIGNLFRRGRRAWRKKHHKHIFTKAILRRMIPGASVHYRFLDLWEALVYHRVKYHWRIPCPIPYDLLVEVS